MNWGLSEVCAMACFTLLIGWVFIAPSDTACAVAFLFLQNSLSSLDLPPTKYCTIPLSLSSSVPSLPKTFQLACVHSFFYILPYLSIHWDNLGIFKNFLMEALFTEGCLKRTSFSYQWLIRPNRFFPLPFPLPQYLINISILKGLILLSLAVFR